MKINLARVSPEGSRFEGEEPPETLGLEKDHFAKAEGPVLYDLEAQVVSHELVVQGVVSAPVSLMCSRCGEFFSTTLRVSSFLRAYELTGDAESVDITGDIREDILLEIPTYPTCSSAGKDGVCSHAGVSLEEDLPQADKPPDDNRWAALDDLESP
jgi:uncharacterized metal-binding protein YceD (DUF177 family)